MVDEEGKVEEFEEESAEEVKEAKEEVEESAEEVKEAKEETKENFAAISSGNVNNSKFSKEKIEEAKEGEYIQINMKVIVVGLTAGIIASLWAVLPFFVNGVSNLFYVTVAIGLLFLFIFGGLKKETLIKSGALAVGIFLLVSYLIVPLVSGLLIGGTIDTSQYVDGDYVTVNLALPGLFCSGCAYSSQNALKGIPGVVDAKVSFDDKSGTVIYDPNLVTSEEIVSNDLIQAYGGEIVNG